MISRGDPDPRVDASANNLAESLYMLSDVFFYNLALAITYCTIDYFCYYDGIGRGSKLISAFTADRFVADNKSLASSKEVVLGAVELAN